MKLFSWCLSHLPTYIVRTLKYIHIRELLLVAMPGGFDQSKAFLVYMHTIYMHNLEK